MSRDPLSAAPRYLVQESVEVVARLELDREAWPWLAEAGLDVDATRVLLRAQAEAAGAALLAMAAAKDEAGVPSILAAAVLEDVQAWQRRVRHALHRAPDDPAGRVAAREVRAALGNGRRVAAAITETATLPARLRELAPALGDVRAGELASEGEALHVRLVTVRQEADLAVTARGRRFQDVVEQTDTLRAILREVRRAFQYASEASDGQIRPLALALLKSVVAPRRAEEDGKSAGDGGGPHEGERGTDEQEGGSDGGRCGSDEQEGGSDEQEGGSDEQEGGSDEQEGGSDERERGSHCAAL